MLHTKLRGNRPAGSGEEDFEGFLPHIVGLEPEPIIFNFVHFEKNEKNNLSLSTYGI